MNTTRFRFSKEDIEIMMRELKKETPEQALECWAYMNYPLKNDCSYHIGRIGKTFIDIAEQG